EPKDQDPRHWGLPNIGTICEDQSTGVDLPNRTNKLIDNLDIAALVVHPWRLVNQVEADVFVGDTFVAFGEGAPVMRGHRKRLLHLLPLAVQEEMRLQVTLVDAVAGNAMKIEVDV